MSLLDAFKIILGCLMQVGFDPPALGSSKAKRSTFGILLNANVWGDKLCVGQRLKVSKGLEGRPGLGLLALSLPLLEMWKILRPLMEQIL